MAVQVIQFNPQQVAVLPQRKLVQMARIGKPDPAACLRSVWALLGLSWDRWSLLVQARCDGAGLHTWQGRDQQKRRTLLLTWHKVAQLLELMWNDFQTYAKPSAINDAAKLIGAWPDKRRLEAIRQSVTSENSEADTDAADMAVDAMQAPRANATKTPHVFAPKPGRVQIMRALHEPEVFRLRSDGLTHQQIAKRMGISRPSVSQMISGTYPYKHD